MVIKLTAAQVRNKRLVGYRLSKVSQRSPKKFDDDLLYPPCKVEMKTITSFSSIVV
ncbi:unnamed protein product [Brassica oleracea var. botrytis]